MMSYRIKNLPLGTPMDLQFLGGIPYADYMQRKEAAKPVPMKRAELPLEVLDARKHIKKRKRS